MKPNTIKIRQAHIRGDMQVNVGCIAAVIWNENYFTHEGYCGAYEILLLGGATIYGLDNPFDKSDTAESRREKTEGIAP